MGEEAESELESEMLMMLVSALACWVMAGYNCLLNAGVGILTVWTSLWTLNSGRGDLTRKINH